MGGHTCPLVELGLPRHSAGVGLITAVDNQLHTAHGLRDSSQVVLKGNNVLKTGPEGAIVIAPWVFLPHHKYAHLT